MNGIAGGDEIPLGAMNPLVRILTEEIGTYIDGRFGRQKAELLAEVRVELANWCAGHCVACKAPADRPDKVLPFPIQHIHGALYDRMLERIADGVELEIIAEECQCDPTVLAVQLARHKAKREEEARRHLLPIASS